MHFFLKVNFPEDETTIKKILTINVFNTSYLPLMQIFLKRIYVQSKFK